jgi:hypothetical protein
MRLGIGGLTLVGALPGVAIAQPEFVPPIVPAPMKDKLQAMRFWSGLIRMEWITEPQGTLPNRT